MQIVRAGVGSTRGTGPSLKAGITGSGFDEILQTVTEKTAGTGEKKAEADAACASSVQGKLNASVPVVYGIKPNARGCITFDMMESRAAELRDGFTSLLHGRLAQEGLRRSPEIDISLSFAISGSGKIVVSGDNPDKAAIERILNEDETLNSSFRQINGLSELIRAGKEAIEFQKAYRENPQEAVSRFAYLFDPDRKTPSYHLKMGSETVGYFQNIV